MSTSARFEHSFRPFTALILVLTLGAGQIACLTTHVEPIGADASFEPERDELRLWDEAKKEEGKLRDKAPLYQDPLLQDYLDQVAGRLAPPEVKGQGPIRIRVFAIKDPTLNAFTYPTGSIYVHTGLLARMENEAQLAMVLGHEATHATHRHALEFTRSARNKQLGFSIASILASIVVANQAGQQAEQGNWTGAYTINQIGNILVGLGLQLGFMAAVNGFGRDLEREADEVGFDRMVRAGYEPRQAPRVFELLKDDKGDGRKMEVFFFGSHPRLDERIGDVKELIAKRPPSVEAAAPPVVNTRDFQMRTRVLVRDDAMENIRLGRLGLAEAEIKKVLALTPNDPVAYYLTGQVAEKRAGEAKDRVAAKAQLDKAMEGYREALRLDPRYPDPYRALGLIAYKSGEKNEALASLRRYLELNPNAQDSQQIRDYVIELQAG